MFHLQRSMVSRKREIAEAPRLRAWAPLAAFLALAPAARNQHRGRCVTDLVRGSETLTNRRTLVPHRCRFSCRERSVHKCPRPLERIMSRRLETRRDDANLKRQCGLQERRKTRSRRALGMTECSRRSRMAQNLLADRHRDGCHIPPTRHSWSYRLACQ